MSEQRPPYACETSDWPGCVKTHCECANHYDALAWHCTECRTATPWLGIEPEGASSE